MSEHVSIGREPQTLMLATSDGWLFIDDAPSGDETGIMISLGGRSGDLRPGEVALLAYALQHYVDTGHLPDGEAFNLMTSERVYTSAELGLSNTGRTPYGYRRGPLQNTLVISESEMETIAIARRLRNEGLSLRQIGDELDRLGRPMRNGKPWEANCVKVMLNSPLQDHRTPEPAAPPRR